MTVLRRIALAATGTLWGLISLWPSGKQTPDIPAPPTTAVRLHVILPDTTAETSTSEATIPPASVVELPPVPETTVPVPANALCPQLWQLASNVGWPTDQLATLDFVMWRESRCHSDATNTKGYDRSYGLLQINTWGYLWPSRRDLCGLYLPEALLGPWTNLQCGLILWERSGWAPWGL